MKTKNVNTIKPLLHTPVDLWKIFPTLPRACSLHDGFQRMSVPLWVLVSSASQGEESDGLQRPLKAWIKKDLPCNFVDGLCVVVMTYKP